MTNRATAARRWTVAAVVGVLAVVAAGACGGASDPVATTAPLATISPSTTSATDPEAVGFSDGDNGRSADVAVGQRVTVILHSSDFVFAPPSDSSVVRADGEPTVTPGGPPCVEEAGSGCGTVVASFLAVSPGEVTLAADRSACVEPECPAGAAHWELALTVSGPTPASEPAPAAEVPTTVAPDPATAGSGIRGTVLFSPVCPVERIPPDPACAPRPGSAGIELVRPDGSIASSGQAGADGVFAIAVAPGSYLVVASAPGPGIGGGCRAVPAVVTVEPDASVTIAVSCDTGIR